jgi:hypothetical protein
MGRVFVISVLRIGGPKVTADFHQEYRGELSNLSELLCDAKRIRTRHFLF